MRPNYRHVICLCSLSFLCLVTPTTHRCVLALFSLFFSYYFTILIQIIYMPLQKKQGRNSLTRLATKAHAAYCRCTCNGIMEWDAMPTRRQQKRRLLTVNIVFDFVTHFFLLFSLNISYLNLYPFKYLTILVFLKQKKCFLKQ